MPVSALRPAVELSRQPAAARRELARIIDDTHWPGDAEGAILAVHEAMVNAHRHGGGVTRATAGFDGRSLVVQVCDRGGGFEMPEAPESPDTAAERGRGLFLIRHLASEAHVVRAGKDVELVLTFGP
jgi:anti-sigma regulatory factor (Ser/Thr protein kinase)